MSFMKSSSAVDSPHPSLTDIRKFWNRKLLYMEFLFISGETMSIS